MSGASSTASGDADHLTDCSATLEKEQDGLLLYVEKTKDTRTVQLGK